LIHEDQNYLAGSGLWSAPFEVQIMEEQVCPFQIMKRVEKGNSCNKDESEQERIDEVLLI
jgi:hypothetical protein